MNSSPNLIANTRQTKKLFSIPEKTEYTGPATTHTVHLGDARHLEWISDTSVHLIVTSPPYFNLKTYNDHPAQLGNWNSYQDFLDQLDEIWRHCYRVLVPGGRLVCIVGDICISRRSNRGRHHVLPLHADISVRSRKIGFDYLTPIIWNKIANAQFEVQGNGGGFLGKPYEPNAIVKNDIEYILMLRKHGAYRNPSEQQRASSRLTKSEQQNWFKPIWFDIPGASTRQHPAPFPLELAYRLVRMFSFTGDIVLDPFSGTATTTIAAIQADRNSIANEIDPCYFDSGLERIREEIGQGVLGKSAPNLIIHNK